MLENHKFISAGMYPAKLYTRQENGQYKLSCTDNGITMEHVEMLTQEQVYDRLWKESMEDEVLLSSEWED